MVLKPAGNSLSAPHLRSNHDVVCSRPNPCRCCLSTCATTRGGLSSTCPCPCTSSEWGLWFESRKVWISCGSSGSPAPWRCPCTVSSEQSGSAAKWLAWVSKHTAQVVAAAGHSQAGSAAAADALLLYRLTQGLRLLLPLPPLCSYHPDKFERWACCEKQLLQPPVMRLCCCSVMARLAPMLGPHVQLPWSFILLGAG